MPGTPPRVSRPSWFDFVMSIDINKPMTELELNMVVNSLKNRTNSKVCIKVESENGETKTIGDEKEDSIVFEMKHQMDSNDKKTGHFLPIVIVNGKREEVHGLTNIGKACGAETLLFLFKVKIIFLKYLIEINLNFFFIQYNELIENGMKNDEAAKQAKEFIDTEPNLRENFIENIRNDALYSTEMRSLYYRRLHEKSSIIGGIKRRPDSDKPGEFIYELDQEDIKKCNVSINSPKEKKNKRGDYETANLIKVLYSNFISIKITFSN